MIYTEEDLKQAYTIGYNEAVDDVNAYIDQESMEFSLDESYDDGYSAVEAVIMNETKSVNKKEHNQAIMRDTLRLANKYGIKDKDGKYVAMKKSFGNDGRHVDGLNRGWKKLESDEDNGKFKKRANDGRVTKDGKIQAYVHPKV